MGWAQYRESPSEIIIFYYNNITGGYAIINRQLRARRALMIFKDVPYMRTIII